MCNREYHNALRLRPIHDGEWEVLDNDASHIWRRRRTREWERQRARSGFLNSSGETWSLAGPSLIVVGDLSKKLRARRRDKTRSFHRVLRLASAKTSSAG